MELFNNNSKELEKETERINNYINTNINRTLTMYNDLLVLSKYSNTNMAINSTILQLVMQQLILKNYKKENNNFQNNLIFLNFPGLELRDIEIEEEKLDNSFSDDDMYRIISNYLKIYHSSSYKYFKTLIENGLIYNVDKNLGDRNCAYFNEFDKGYLFIENNNDCATMAKLINRLIYLQNLKKGVKESSDFKEFEPKMAEKDFLEYLAEEHGLQDEVEKYYINYYKKMQDNIAKLDEIKNYPSFKDLMDNDKLQILDSIPYVVGDALSDSAIRNAKVERKIYGYLKEKKNDYFDKKVLAYIGKSEYGLSQDVNSQFRIYRKTK